MEFDKNAEMKAIELVNDNFKKGKYYNFRNTLDIDQKFNDYLKNFEKEEEKYLNICSVGEKNYLIQLAQNLNEIQIEQEYKAIIEFKKYKILCRTTDENTKISDCDMCDMVMYLWCLWLKNKGYEIPKFSERIITVKKDDFSFEVETDTVNSLDTTLNNFLRSIKIDGVGKSLLVLYNQCKDLVFNNNSVTVQPFQAKNPTDVQAKNPTDVKKKQNTDSQANMRDLWVIKNLNVIYEYCQKQNNSAPLLALNRWAELTHTFGNFMIGPKGFNSKGFSHSNAKLPYNMFGDTTQNTKGESIEEFFRQLQQMDEYLKLEHMDIYFEGNNSDIWKNPVKRLGYISKDENGKEKYNEIERIYAICNLIEQRNDLFYNDFKDIVCKKKENVE